MSESLQRKAVETATKAAEKKEGGKTFLESISGVFGELKEKFSLLVDNIKKMFWIELSALQTDVEKNKNQKSKKTNSKKEFVPRPNNPSETFQDIHILNRKDFEDMIVYLSHQQGPGGIRQIVEQAEKWWHTSDSIKRHMANNVSIVVYNRRFGTNYLSKEQLQKEINPRNFLLYWQKLYQQKQANYSKNTKYDHYIKPLSDKYNIPVDSIRTAIGIESDFNPIAWKGKTYVWLMQISPTVAKQYGFSPADRLNPQKNLEMWVRYMAENRRIVDNLPVNQTYAALTQKAGWTLSRSWEAPPSSVA